MKVSSIMKVAVIALIFLIGSAFIFIQADSTRPLLDVTAKEKANDQLPKEVQAGQKLEALKSGTNDNKPKDSPEKVMPTADANSLKNKSNTVEGDNSKLEDEKNDNYGAYGNSSDSTTYTDHRFTDDDPPH